MKKIIINLLLVALYAILSACYAEVAYKLLSEIVRDLMEKKEEKAEEVKEA